VGRAIIDIGNSGAGTFGEESKKDDAFGFKQIEFEGYRIG
jgi:hypothetical protein